MINYITYADDTVNVPPGSDPSSRPRAAFVNTPLATLSGSSGERNTTCSRGSASPACRTSPAATRRSTDRWSRSRRWKNLGVRFTIRTAAALGVSSARESSTPRTNGHHPRHAQQPAGRADRRIHRVESPQLLERQKNLSLVGGIENIFDKTYEHRYLRLIGPARLAAARVLEPGTPLRGNQLV